MKNTVKNKTILLISKIGYYLKGDIFYLNSRVIRQVGIHVQGKKINDDSVPVWCQPRSLFDA